MLWLENRLAQAGCTHQMPPTGQRNFERFRASSGCKAVEGTHTLLPSKTFYPISVRYVDGRSVL